MSNRSREIIRELEKLYATAFDSRQIFDDWLAVVFASLEALPSHAQNVSQGKPMVDTPETTELFMKVKARYGDYMKHIEKAFAILIQSAEEGWDDVIGDVYMEMGANKWAGQFFTPFCISQMMAGMTLTDIDGLIKDRVTTALQKSPAGQAALFSGLVIQNKADAEKWFYERVLPLALPYLDPIKICDPACGSGVMFLSSASLVPRWALNFGIVQFYGMDIDETCVKMAKVNCFLHGLNGFYLKCVMSATLEEIRSIPEPLAGAYQEAITAKAENNAEKLEEIIVEIKTGKYTQANIFDMVES